MQCEIIVRVAVAASGCVMAMANPVAVMATPEGAAANPAVDVFLGACPHLIKHLAAPGIRLQERRAMNKDSDTNIQIKVEGQWMQGHASVLGAHCAVIDRAVQDREPPLRLDFQTMNITKAAMDKVFEYAYTGEIRMTRRLLQPVLRAAVRLEVHGLVALMEEYLIAMSKQIQYSLFALQVGASTPVSDRAVSELVENCCAHFPDMLRQPTFLKLSVESLCMLLSRDSLRNRVSEKQILMAALDWIYTDQKTQIMYAEKVLSCVRFDKLKLTDIENIMSTAFHTSPGSGCTFRVSALVHNKIAKKSGSNLPSPSPMLEPFRFSSPSSQKQAKSKQTHKRTDDMVDAEEPSESSARNSKTGVTSSWTTITSTSCTQLVQESSKSQGIPDLPPEPNANTKVSSNHKLPKREVGFGIASPKKESPTPSSNIGIPNLPPPANASHAEPKREHIGFGIASPKREGSPSPTSKVGIPELPPPNSTHTKRNISVYTEDNNLLDCPHTPSKLVPNGIGFNFAKPSVETCDPSAPKAGYVKHQSDYQYDRESGWKLTPKAFSHRSASDKFASVTPSSTRPQDSSVFVTPSRNTGIPEQFASPVSHYNSALSHQGTPAPTKSTSGSFKSRTSYTKSQGTGVDLQDKLKSSKRKDGSKQRAKTHFYQECKVYADRVTHVQGCRNY